MIERAYQIQKMESQLQSVWDQLVGNFTDLTNFNATGFLQGHAWFFLPEPLRQAIRRPAPTVYIRLDSSTQYRKCRIVNVQPDLDLAVLQIEPQMADDGEEEIFPAMDFGSSSNLLVGQGLIAIGNPFGLDNSVTSGVVSALNREIKTGDARGNNQQQQPIRNCIQTDCAINPGNSGKFALVFLVIHSSDYPLTIFNLLHQVALS